MTVKEIRNLADGLRPRTPYDRLYVRRTANGVCFTNNATVFWVRPEDGEKLADLLHVEMNHTEAIQAYLAGSRSRLGWIELSIPPKLAEGIAEYLDTLFRLSWDELGQDMAALWPTGLLVEDDTKTVWRIWLAAGRPFLFDERYWAVLNTWSIVGMALDAIDAGPMDEQQRLSVAVSRSADGGARGLILPGRAMGWEAIGAQVVEWYPRLKRAPWFRREGG